MMIRDLGEEAEAHNPLVHCALGVIALVRPLRRALEAVTHGSDLSPGEKTAVGIDARWLILGLLAVSARVESLLPLADERGTPDDTPAPVYPGLLR